MHIYFTHIKCKFMLHTKDDFAKKKMERKPQITCSTDILMNEQNFYYFIHFLKIFLLP